ncbi:hypothetical protein G6F32_015753 [Rhizopus arrhizus]|nr:hypothetical protein G6F32_015753 [Rhizopus arrhizus]
MLAALVRGLGALPVHVLHARDTEADLLAAFKTLLADCDLVLSVGGVSVGERDLVKPALATLGGELSLWKVRMKPGKPVALAQSGGKPVGSLPGNPVSAAATRSSRRAASCPCARNIRARTAARNSFASSAAWPTTAVANWWPTAIRAQA